MIKTENRNLKAQKLGRKGQRASFYPVIKKIRASKKGFFLLSTLHKLEIFEFNNEGTLLASYWGKQPNNYDVNDFIVRNGTNGVSFYLLQISPNKKIDVFRPKI